MEINVAIDNKKRTIWWAILIKNMSRKQRDAETMIQLIQKHLKPGTTAYDTIHNSKNILDPVTAANIK